MLAAVLKEYNRELSIEEVEKPSLSYGEILLKVRYCGICGTDLKIVSGKLKHIVTLPHIPGHEIAGEVVDVGEGVKTVKQGDTGIVYLYITCRDCELCRTGRENICYSVRRLGFELNGGFAQYVRIPEYNFCRVAHSTELYKMAILPDAVETPYHVLKNLAHVKPGNKVMIVGAGGLGLHAIQISKLMGAQVMVVDIREKALELAEELGADVSINSSEVIDEVMKWTDSKGVDFVIEGVGTDQTISWSLYCLKKGGKLFIMGYDPLNPVRVRPLDLHYNEWSIVGARLGTKQELIEVIELIESGKILPVISGLYQLSDINRALNDLKEGSSIGRMVIEIP